MVFIAATGELADFSDYNMRAGKGFIYRYYNGKALYSFGHGLSYTNYEYTDLKIDKTTVSDSDELIVLVKVKNCGKLDGEEVVQLYIKDVESYKWMAIKQLRGFERVSLKKGKVKTIEFKLNVGEDFRYYDSMYRKYMVEPGRFEIQVGASSSDIRLKELVKVE